MQLSCVIMRDNMFFLLAGGLTFFVCLRFKPKIKKQKSKNFKQKHNFPNAQDSWINKIQVSLNVQFFKLKFAK